MRWWGHGWRERGLQSKLGQWGKNSEKLMRFYSPSPTYVEENVRHDLKHDTCKLRKENFGETYFMFVSTVWLGHTGFSARPPA